MLKKFFFLISAVVSSVASGKQQENVQKTASHEANENATTLMHQSTMYENGTNTMNRKKDTFAGQASLSWENDACQLTLESGEQKKYTLLPFLTFQGASGVRINPRSSSSTWPFKYEAGKIPLFSTDRKCPEYFYLLACKPDSIIHSTFEIPEKDKFLLCAVQDGWFKYSADSDLNKLKLKQYGKPEIKLMDAECDASGTTILLKHGDWRLPLFSKNNSFLDNDILLVFPGKNKMYLRSSLNSARQLEDVLSMLKKQTAGFTIYAKPDSMLHEHFSVPAQNRSSIMRIHLTRTDIAYDYFPSRGKNEYYISKDKDGVFYYGCDADSSKSVKLERFSEKPENTELFRAVRINTATGEITADFAYDNELWTADIIATPREQEKTLVLINKDNSFLTKYLPEFAGKNVLMSVENRMIRFAVQYSNGECRIPQMKEPFAWTASVSVKQFFNGFLVRWGDAAFFIDEASLNTAMNAGGCWAVKVPCAISASPAAFCMTEKNYMSDTALDKNNYFLVLSRNDGVLPSLLDRKLEEKYVLAVKRTNQGWEFLWNDVMQFELPPLFQ